MKLKTSFFNPTVLWKDITRFFPLWGLYTVFMVLFLSLFSGETPESFVGDATETIMMFMGVLNFAYGGLASILLFSNLFDPRSASTLHALPLRREGWFLTHLCAGVLFCVVPNFLGMLFAFLLLQQYWYLALIWFVVMLFQYLFFFGIGAFSCQCAGTRLGAMAVYMLFNFLSVLAAFLVAVFYAPELYGVQISYDELCSASPVVGFSGRSYFDVAYNRNYDSRFSDFETVEFRGLLWEDWRYLLIAPGIGLVLQAVSVVLYRRRKIESAGDFMAVKEASPVFLILYSLIAAALLHLLGKELGIAFLLAGLAIGFFPGLMLLQKKVNVFNRKTFFGFGALALALLGSIFITKLDPLGIVSYVPETDQIQSVTVGETYAYYEDYPTNLVTLDTPEELDALRELHQDLITNRVELTNPYAYEASYEMEIIYTLKSGRKVSRAYYLDKGSQRTAASKLLSRLDIFTDPQMAESLLKRAQSVEFSCETAAAPSMYIWRRKNYGDMTYAGSDIVHISEVTLDQDAVIQGLWEAVRQDCLEGKMAQSWSFRSDSIGNLEILYEEANSSTTYVFVHISNSCTNTIAYLNSLQN